MSVIDHSARFRERHRIYGLAVPYHDLSPMLAEGWRLGEPVEDMDRHERIFLLPPERREPCGA
jgi:hypothetical protein